MFPVEPWRLRLVIQGKPVSWKRAGRGGGMTFTPKDVRDYQRRVKDHALRAWRGRAPWEGPVRATIWVSFPLNKTGKEAGAGRFGDADNFAKCVLDALNGLVYKDDRQVWPVETRRARGTPLGCLYVELTEQDPEALIEPAPEWARGLDGA